METISRFLLSIVRLLIRSALLLVVWNFIIAPHFTIATISLWIALPVVMCYDLLNMDDGGSVFKVDDEGNKVEDLDTDIASTIWFSVFIGSMAAIIYGISLL